MLPNRQVKQQEHSDSDSFIDPKEGNTFIAYHTNSIQYVSCQKAQINKQTEVSEGQQDKVKIKKNK